MPIGNGRIWHIPLTALAALAIAAPAALSQTGGAQQPQERSPQTQERSPQMQPPGQAEQTPQISEDKLKAFALAATQVREINTSYQPRIAEAEAEKDSGKSATLRKEAQDKMMKAVEDQGLSVDSYNQIYVVARADPAVWDRIVQYMKQPQGSPGPQGSR